MVKKIIIIGANEFQDQLVVKAKNMDFETHVFAWEQGAIAREHADYFYPISIREKERILKYALKIKPQAVISVGSDLAVPTVNYIAHHLNLIGNSLHSSIVSTNKYEMRRTLSKFNLPCPKFEIREFSNSNFPDNFELPFMIKPLDRSGGRGVKRINNLNDFQNGILEIKEVSFSNQYLIEEYFEGVQYSVEMISFEGNHYFLAITEEFYTKGPYFIERQQLTPGRISSENLKKVISVVKKSLDALEIRYGASHSEIRVNNKGEIKIIEIAGRMGGDFRSDLVELTTGVDFIKQIINTANNIPPQIHIKNNNIAGLFRWVLNKRDVAIIRNIEKEYSSNIIRIGPIAKIDKDIVRNMAERYGYIFIKGETQEECLNIIKKCKEGL
ncbi:ATP-grasp domain-containing protein [Candidatus Harpocratesius sp.]